MGNVYFGDLNLQFATDGAHLNTSSGANWNNTGAWYSQQASDGSCCSVTPSVPLARVPNPSTDTVIISAPMIVGPTGYPGNVYTGAIGYVQNGGWNFQFSSSGPVSIYPSGGILCTGVTWTRDINVQGGQLYGSTFSGRISGNLGLFTNGMGNAMLLSGNYYGNIYLIECVLNGGNFYSGIIFSGSNQRSLSSAFIILSGNFYGPFTNSASTELISSSSVAKYCPTIQGGNFYGTFNKYVYNTAIISGAADNITGLVPYIINGGTFSPAVTINYANPTGTVWPFNPGFGNNSSVFSPIITVTGYPNILGMGIF